MTWLEQLGTLLPSVMGWDRAWPYLLGSLAIGYVFGSIPFGLLITKVMNLGDLRSIGSGNIGATNVLRTGNKAAAAGTLAFDMAKGWAAVVLLTAMWGELPGQIAGLGAFLGHCFPVWLRFQGGKGVATFLGVVIGLSPLAGLGCCLAWIIGAFLTRISSAAALLMSLAAPILMWIMADKGAIWVVAPMIILLWLRHHENIGRLAKGEEPRIGRR